MPRVCSQNWSFTINNYEQADVDHLKGLTPERYQVIFGEEVAPTTGTRHLQGFIWCAKRTERSTLERVLGGHAWLDVSHSPTYGIAYAIKDGIFHSNWKEEEMERLEDIYSYAVKYGPEFRWIASCLENDLEGDWAIEDPGVCAYNTWRHNEELRACEKSN